ncbi:MAG: hypothetical protein QG623_250 [Patescibacteria group bacterium]|nr:hypothetical protein [Patescibacteria group bacterium]
MSDLFNERLTYSSAGTRSQFYILGEHDVDSIRPNNEFTDEEIAEGIALPDGRIVTEAPRILHTELRNGEWEDLYYHRPALLLTAGTLILEAYHHVYTEYVPITAQGRSDGGADLTVFPLLRFSGSLKPPKHPIERARLPEGFCRAAVDPNTRVIHTDILMAAFDRLLEGQAEEQGLK